MTKSEILMELKKYGIEATLRPRKSTLLALLENVKKEDKDGMLTSDVIMFDDLRAFEKKEVTTEEWMDFTKVNKREGEDLMVPAIVIFLLGALVVYLWEDGVSFMEMFGTILVLMYTVGAAASIRYFVKGN